MHIQEFQRMMYDIYFHRDLKRGMEGTYKWLVDEVKELGEALRNGDRRDISEEFADVIAWLASLANVVEIELEKAALSKYSGKCPKCSKARCECTF